MTAHTNAIELAQSPLSEHGVRFLSAGPAFHQIVSAAQWIIIPILEKESDLPSKVFCLSSLQQCQMPAKRSPDPTSGYSHSQSTSAPWGSHLEEVS